MLYKIEKGLFEPVKLEKLKKEEEYYIGIFKTKDFHSIFQKFHINKGFIKDFKVSRNGKFESHEGFDVIFLKAINKEIITFSENKIFIYLDKDKLLFFCDDEKIINIITEYVKTENGEITFDKAIYYLFKQLTFYDGDLLDEIEEKITILEDDLLEDGNQNCVKEIITIRRNLMVLKSYYEQFYNILDGIQENENNIISKDTLRYFKIFANRIDRLSRNTLNLREYITQVREAYQAQVDISLNKIMKIFTVITAIFLPLSLIAAWYGMNIKMPEFNWVYGYPFVIALSLVVVLICIKYFKSNKWF